ncbi:Fe(3+)-hydroxamate ABC transporter permease FhuB [Arhodomonas sp. SL1]|uniref:Fe(3+)-hydroxamate ABC transporter permease FhuB n=1 Tax=Arhodomonas sp. SL1 TaxID=3425691 RepID=UPI003F880760
MSEGSRGLSPARLAVGLAGLAVVLAALALQDGAGIVDGLRALREAPSHPELLRLRYSWWPRLISALLCGAALGLAGVLLQQVLSNPVAAPTTLGVASGANLALMLATLLAPGLLAAGREWPAFAGGIAAMGLVMALAWRRQAAPLLVVLAGMVVNLYLGALAMVLLLFHHEALKGLMIWGAGSLAQTGWDGVAFLAPRLALAGGVALLLVRTLTVLELDDEGARGLGVSLRRARIAGLSVAVFLTACVVAEAGVIAFVGLLAPNIARLAGARRLAPRLGWSALIGALVLAATDLALRRYAGGLATLVPTGAATAALGAPLLLWLIPRLGIAQAPPPAGHGLFPRHAAPARLLTAFALALLIAVVLALGLGQGVAGWHWLAPWDPVVLEWRLPRVLAAAAAGVTLALAGAVIQRLTGNPLASPEVLGISGGSAMALIAAIFLLPQPGRGELAVAGTAGALAALAVLIALNRGNGMRPERVLLTGVAIMAMFEAVRGLVLAGGDPRTGRVLAWLSGSTYHVELPGAVALLLLAIVLAAAVFAGLRWLELLTLGPETAQALGVPVAPARLLLLVAVALLTTGATLVVGPLSFVGLIAPHTARLLGLARSAMHLPGAVLVGAVLTVLADWLGRQILFPQEIPAGLAASLIGGAYFLWTLRRL